MHDRLLKILSIPLVGLLVFFALFLKFLPAIYTQSEFVLMQHFWAAPFQITLVFAIPSIFHLSSRSKIDNFVGSLSYPFYLVHYFALLASGGFGEVARAPIAFSATLLSSIFILYFLETWPLAKINPFMLAGIDPLVAQRMTGWEKGETGCPSQLGLSWLGREW